MTARLTLPGDFHQLLVEDAPLLDVRAEIEFDKGQLPNSTNIPILTTDERHRVGITYKNDGNAAAVALGHQLVAGDIREQRIRAWSDFLAANPRAHLFCWRGGSRSQITQQWLLEQGVDVPLVQGGYKALRRYLIDRSSWIVEHSPLFIIGGKTGSAKTLLLNELPTGIDLEAHADHRGSSFGRKVTTPPAQVTFENTLFCDLLKTYHAHPGEALFFEDESRRVGAVSVPLETFNAMQRAPVAVVEMDMAQRIENVLDEYVRKMHADYRAAHGDEGDSRYCRYLLGSLERIRKRLGGERYRSIGQQMQQALDHEMQTGEVNLHRQWIRRLLAEYYDPMYLSQLDGKQDRIMFRGSYQEVLQWALQKIDNTNSSNTRNTGN